MTAQTHIIGLDAGNSAAKMVVYLEGAVQGPLRVLIPNVSARAEALDIPPQSSDIWDRLHIEIMGAKSPFDGERFIGALAARQLFDVEQDRRRNKSESDNINLITPALLAAICQPGDKVVLGIGSPFTDFAAQRERIVERLQRRFSVRFGDYSTKPGAVVDFEVTKVYPYPQTAAGYVAQAISGLGAAHPEWNDAAVLVVDLGLGQTGLALLDCGEVIKAGCVSIDEPAFLRVAQGVQRHLNTEYQRDLTLPEVLRVTEAGRYQINAHSIDLSPVIDLECEELAVGLRRRCEELIPSRLRDRVSALLLIGGGAMTPGAADKFAAAYRLPVFVGDDPRYANALGLAEQARMKYEKESKVGVYHAR